MEIERLADIIPNPKGTAGELVNQLVEKGYEFDHALKIVNEHMFMEIEKLADIIPNPKGTAGELIDQLVKKGYEFEYALMIVNKHMFRDKPSTNPKNSTWTDEYTGPHPKLLE